MAENNISLDEVNRCIRLFGDCQKAFMRSEKRAGLRSVLFDVPRRSSIGWHCVYRKAYPLLKELSQYASPEELGAKMKRLCSRPYYLTLSIVMCSYLGARQQLMQNRGLSRGESFPENLDELAYVIDWWQRVCRSYRNDGQLLPEQSGCTQQIIPGNVINSLNLQLATTNVAEAHHRMRRMAATLELYSFILHGEQRDGIFGHGPYTVDGDQQLVVLEFTDLQNEFLPWAKTAARNRYPNLAIAFRLQGATARFHVFGSMLFDPSDIAPNLRAIGLFTRLDDGRIVSVDFAEIEDIQALAADAQNELYLKAAEWTPRFKAEYGVHLFANHLRSFFDLAGQGNRFDEKIRGEFQAAAEEVIDVMLAQSEPPSMWKFMATTDGDYFWPAVADKKALIHHGS